MTRYALPLIPFLIISAAYASNWLFQHISAQLSRFNQNTCKRQTVIMLILISSLIAEPLTHSIQWDRLLLQGDTRQIAANWLLEHAPTNTAIATGPRLGQIRLPLNYGQLLLETGPNNMRPPQQPSLENITNQTKLINSYDATILKQYGIRFVVLYGSNLLFSSPVWEMERYFNLYHLTPVVHIHNLKPNTEKLISRNPAATYDPLDALFIPYVGFNDSAFTGPEIFIFDLDQLDRLTPKNPKSLK